MAWSEDSRHTAKLHCARLRQMCPKRIIFLIGFFVLFKFRVFLLVLALANDSEFAIKSHYNLSSPCAFKHWNHDQQIRTDA